MEPAIGAYSVSKSFGSTKALNEVSFEVSSSSIFGFIGPDGSGKTTLFRIIATLLVPDNGRVSVFGYDPVKDYRQLRKITGYMPGRFSLYQDLSVEENLRFYSTVFGTTVQQNYELIRGIYEHLEPFRKRPAGKLSGGMKQKLALCCALIHKPRLLILDEPTTGVDAVSRTEFWEMLAGLRNSDITVLVSTPYMDEAMRCDSVALIQNGSVLTTGTPSEITSGFGSTLWAATAKERLTLLQALRSYPKTISAYPFGDSVHVTFSQTSPGDELKQFIAKAGITEFSLLKIAPSIEDRFLELISNDQHHE
jgi:ABC-type multidrug transport system ATPase subunit